METAEALQYREAPVRKKLALVKECSGTGKVPTAEKDVIHGLAVFQRVDKNTFEAQA